MLIVVPKLTRSLRIFMLMIVLVSLAAMNRPAHADPAADRHAERKKSLDPAYTTFSLTRGNLEEINDGLRQAAIKQLEAWKGLADKEYRTLVARSRYNEMTSSLRDISIAEDADNVDKATTEEIKQRIARQAQERGQVFPPLVSLFKSRHFPKK